MKHRQGSLLHGLLPVQFSDGFPKGVMVGLSLQARLMSPPILP